MSFPSNDSFINLSKFSPKGRKPPLKRVATALARTVMTLSAS
eukprot:CAMPEP_0115505276 /NCGR_PEP_ID=MMETSP0271-20121206/70474_1 /TAXON_ID=71861 /ORGANISM="Scrippsiella trochoidea, Strain CCMP3099" /LENGTH=41 /DNA_ID= /DNA_START= /DNA_END= /DNA_ORIENTATION=